MEKFSKRIYEYKLKVNEQTAKRIDQTIEDANFVRNLCIRNNEIPKASTSSKELLNGYIAEFPNLKRSDYSALINALIMLSYNTNPKEKEEGKSYVTTYSDFLDRNYPFTGETVYLPKVGRVKVINSRKGENIGKIERLTIKRKSDNCYYLYVHTTKIIIINEKDLDSDLSIGLDYSISHFAIDNNGNIYNKPNYYTAMQKKLKRKQNLLARKEKGSANYKRIRNQIIKEYEKSHRKNMDYLHKKSTELANRYDFVFVEDLNLKKMVQTHNFAKGTMENSYAKFVSMLEYKMEEKGKKLIKINRWFPSSKMCHVCGTVNQNLRLNERKWICPNCKTELDRDINSAINIREEGLKQYKLSLDERCT